MDYNVRLSGSFSTQAIHPLIGLDFFVMGLALPQSKSVVPMFQNGQWWIEIIGWEKSVCATVRITIADYAVGPTAQNTN